ncbi:glycosyltransferase family 2 protein [Selaginella moellendorffii]|uniref:glucomannan 4-beta-mannosyltransferase n=1 Tax=Selaginella moellendorffii TaxID=88036 RepID=D8QXE5_SELML|nr:glycosyltransferase family 2 protein [Selaginella moellendorffii]
MQGVQGEPSMIDQINAMWLQIRAPYIAPALQVGVNICLVMLLMLFVERLYMALVMVLVKLSGKRPENKYKWEPIKDDLESGNSAYPMVLVQVPMYNEREVYQLSIGAACGLSWPSDRIIVQILDDSTDLTIKNLVELECQRWASKGVNIKYEIRDNRNGYKAGALKEGMKRSYVKDCDYVAIFDADFQPEPDFLWRTIPYLVHNADIGLVQARWKFVNADECMMTRMQEMSLSYHFTVEQSVGSATYAFFGFNGTAGVWRIAAISEAGGWNSRTTVEDMDLAVRAGLRGWKFVYLDDLSVKNELPSTFKAYRYQQHRWSCGPANLFRKMIPGVLAAKKVSMLKKFSILYSFFLVRKIVAHLVTFIFFCVVVPTCVLVPEVNLPKWGSIYLPSMITLLNCMATPKSLPFLVFWVLFENVMSMHRTKATITGLLDIGRVNEWIVTEKLGDALKIKFAKLKQKPKQKIGERQAYISRRFHVFHLIVGLYIFFCASYDLAFGRDRYYIYLYLQAVAFFIMGFGYIGTYVPNT